MRYGLAILIAQVGKEGKEGRAHGRSGTAAKVAVISQERGGRGFGRGMSTRGECT